MISLYRNDNFKVYLAEAKKVGSKYIHVPHGGGLTFKMTDDLTYITSVADKIISWDNTEQLQNIL